MSLESSSAPSQPVVPPLPDLDLPSPPGGVVRVRTLLCDKAGTERQAWLADGLRPALGPECAHASIILGRQCHEITVRDADQEWHLAGTALAPGVHEFPRCDGLLTRKLDTVLAIRTADCVPIIVSDATRRWIGAVHAGWRGTLAGILANLLRKAHREGCQPGDLHLWIGPHIRACHYPVSPSLSLRFQQAYPERNVVRQGRHISLLDANISQATAAGIPEANITASPLCTFEPGNGLPSYRRDGKGRGEIVTTAVILATP